MKPLLSNIYGFKTFAYIVGTPPTTQSLKGLPKVPRGPAHIQI